MKNKTLIMVKRVKTQVPDWLYQDAQDDDFLMGKTPLDLEDAWEEE
jgi:hypothetical protein